MDGRSEEGREIEASAQLDVVHHARGLAAITHDERLRAELLRIADEMEAEARAGTGFRHDRHPGAGGY